MTGEILTTVFWRLVQPLLLAAGKHGIKKLLEEPPISRAIRTTAEAFPAIENVDQALASWCTSEDFLNLLRKLRAGERHLTDAAVVSSFIEHGGFYAAAQTESLAREILTTFLAKAEEELYGSDAGLSVHAQREEILHAQTQAAVHEGRQTAMAEIRSLREVILQRLPPDDISLPAQLRERVLHAKVDAARSLIEEGKASAARSILEHLRRDAAADALSGELQFRIATNLGACALRLEDEETAKTEFRIALRYEPENPKALANAASAELLDGNFEEALRLSAEARRLNERDDHATSIYLQALHGAGRQNDIERLVREEDWIREDAVCTLALGSLKHKDQQWEEAEKCLRTSLQKDPENPQTYSLLAQTIIIPLQMSLREDPPLPWQLPEPVEARAREAEAFLTRAAAILERQENRQRLCTVLVNRAAVRVMLGDFRGVVRDCDRVLAEDATDSVALRNKSIALLQLDRAAEAVECLERIDDPEERSKTVLMLAAAYWETEQYEKVIATLTPAWKPGSRERPQIDTGDILAAAYMKLGKPEEAGRVVHRLVELWPGDPDALAALGRQRRREGKPQEAVAILREALSYAKGRQRQRIALELADLHDDLRNHSEAAELYSSLVEKQKDTPTLRKYLIALFNAGSYREALPLAKTLRADGPAIPVITEIEALILEYIGDLESARSLRVQLSEIDSKNVSHRVRLALLDIRRGEREQARQPLSEIGFEDIKNNAMALIQVAEARSMLGMGDVLPLAYRARQLAFDDPNIHLAYLNLFLRREERDRSVLEPTEVGLDCTVHLRRNGETRTFTLLKEDPINRDRGELSLTDSLAAKLLGKRKGDEVVLKDTPLEQLSYELADVQSKYVFAFQETLSGFTTWFPDHPGLHRVEFKEGDLSKIKTLLDARQRRISEVMRLYRKRNITLGVFARLVGSPLSIVWAGMVRSPDGIVIASSGAVEDARRETELLSSARDLVVDLTALLTFEYIGLLDRLTAGFQRVFVPQAVLDEINETLSADFFGPRPTMTVWKEGDQYVRQEITPEALEQGQKFLQGIRSFIESRAVVAPAAGLLDFARAKLEELQGILGREAIGAILVARERTLLLFSDDFGLRGVARNDWQVEGVWSQAVLVNLRDRGIVSDEEYREAIRRLALGNYYFVSINADDLMWMLIRNEMRPTYEVARILSLLEGPDCSEESAVRIIADLIRKVWLENILYNQKLWVLDLALGVLAKGRVASRVMERLKAELRTRFALMPLALPAIFRSIHLWGKQRLLQAGMLE